MAATDATHVELSSQTNARYVRTLTWPNNSGPVNGHEHLGMVYQAGTLRSICVTCEHLYVFIGRHGSIAEVPRRLLRINLRTHNLRSVRIDDAVPSACHLLTVLHYGKGGARRPLVVFRLNDDRSAHFQQLITATGQTVCVGEFLCRRVLQFEDDTLLVGVRPGPPGTPSTPCRIYLSTSDGVLNAQVCSGDDPLPFVERLRFDDLASVCDYVLPCAQLGVASGADPIECLPPGTRRMVDGPVLTTARNSYQASARAPHVHMHCAGALFWIDSSCIRTMDNARAPAIEWLPSMSIHFAPHARAIVRTLLCLRQRGTALDRQPMHLFHVLLRWVVIALTTSSK